MVAADARLRRRLQCIRDMSHALTRAVDLETLFSILHHEVLSALDADTRNYLATVATAGGRGLRGRGGGGASAEIVASMAGDPSSGSLTASSTFVSGVRQR